VKFPDGETFEAQDVKYSFETYLDPKNRRATFAKGIAKVEVKDPYTVDVITTEPLASALFNVVRMYILPKDAREKLGAQAFSQHPIGTGPYKFVEWKRDQQLVLEANPGYWRGAVNPKRLVFRVVKDAATRTAELRSGGVDIIAAPSVPQLELLTTASASPSCTTRRSSRSGWPTTPASPRRGSRSTTWRRCARTSSSASISLSCTGPSGPTTPAPWPRCAASPRT